MRYLAICVLISATAIANTRAPTPLPSAPPKGRDVVAFGNTPPAFARRLSLTREQLMAFLDQGQIFFILPKLLHERLEATRIGHTQTDVTMVTCNGSFSDKQKNMFFWRLAAPEFLIISDENGRSCFVYLSPSPVQPNKALEPTPTSVTPPAAQEPRQP